MKENAFRAAGALIFVGLCAVLAAGCGSGSSSASGTTTGSSTGQTSTSGGAASVSQYQSCLKAQGVDLPSFPGNGNGGPPQGTPPQGAPPQGGGQGGPGGGFGGLSDAQRQKFQAAQTACAKYLPAGARNGGGFFGGGGGAQNSQAFAAYRNCLKLHGVTLSQGFRPSASAATRAKVQKAMTACASLRPSPPGGGGQTSTTPST